MASSSSQPTASAATATEMNVSKGEIERHDTPVCLVLGMAGSGKTTFVDALSAYIEDPNDDEGEVTDDEELASQIARVTAPFSELKLDDMGKPIIEEEEEGEEEEKSDKDSVFVINLDPAVRDIPYEANIDIRDTIKYKDIMRDYKLGPNGGIITSLNLYATRFDQVLNIMDKRCDEYSKFLIDTPGQIETFTWSASGAIITEALSFSYPTMVLYVIDTVRCQDNCMTFISNMLYACSIMYKTKLPMVIIFNKCDVLTADQSKQILNWLSDFDAFDEQISKSIHNYTADLTRSMAMSLFEFYQSIPCIQVSSVTNQGLDQVIHEIHEAVKTFKQEYLPFLDQRKKQKEDQQNQTKSDQFKKFKNDRSQDEHENDFLLSRQQKEQPVQNQDDIGYDDDDNEQISESNAVSNLTNDQRERLRRMMDHLPGEQSKLQKNLQREVEEEEEAREEREAYEEYRKYIEAVKGKKLPPPS